jgi:hypothetical protein
MSVLLKILPGTGRWHCEAMTEGSQSFLKRKSIGHCPDPSTILWMVPLPVPGRI